MIQTLDHHFRAPTRGLQDIPADRRRSGQAVQLTVIMANSPQTKRRAPFPRRKIGKCARSTKRKVAETAKAFFMRAISQIHGPSQRRIDFSVDDAWNPFDRYGQPSRRAISSAAGIRDGRTLAAHGGVVAQQLGTQSHLEGDLHRRDPALVLELEQARHHPDRAGFPGRWC